jgi:hypothetical protein
MKYLALIALILSPALFIVGCNSDLALNSDPRDSDASKTPVYQQSPPPAAPTTPGNVGTLTDPTRNTLNQTGTSEQNAGSSSPAGATGGAMGQ